jgi:predicted PurR-regulated permease PerM
LVWLPGAVALLSSGRALAAVVLVAVGVGPTAVVDNILRPKLIGDDARIHQILILFGVIGGITVFGLFGFLIGPIVMAIFVQLLSVYREEFQPDVDRPPAEDN